MDRIKAGDDVVCVKTHSQGVVIKGRVYTVRDVLPSPCGCMTLVDVGLKTNRPMFYCNNCGMHLEKTDKAWHIGIDLFRKLLTDSEQEDMRNVLNEVLTVAK